MLFTFGETVMDVDVAQTRAYYSRESTKTARENCRCAGCQNFDRAILQAPEGVLSFLKDLGIDPQKPCEVFGLAGVPDEKGGYLYGGWYHVVGRLIKGEEDPQKCYKPDECFEFTVGFTDKKEKMGFVERDFPAPVLELSVRIYLPWLL